MTYTVEIFGKGRDPFAPSTPEEDRKLAEHFANCTPDEPCAGLYTCKAHSRCDKCNGQTELISHGFEAKEWLTWKCLPCGKDERECTCE